MKKKSRQAEDINVSFLDVICCGFGAIVLLLMITKIVDPTALEKSEINADGQIADLQEQLFEIRGETRILNRDMTVKQEQLSIEEEKIAILKSKLAEIDARYQALVTASTSQKEEQGELELARQRLTEEMKRLLANSTPPNDIIGGIPIDSEYVIFVIDTSPSMRENAWKRLLDEVRNALEIYPQLKGIQVLSDNAEYMFPGFSGEWIPDTPARRNAIINTLTNWSPISDSNPIRGIREAVGRFYSPDKKISVFILGDDLNSNARIQDVINTIDRLNRRLNSPEPLVRIHGIAFPVSHLLGEGRFDERAARYAAFMLELTRRNGGAFIALSDYRRQEGSRSGL